MTSISSDRYDLHVYDVYDFAQCEQAVIEWFGTYPPFKLSVYKVKLDWAGRMPPESDYALWQDLSDGFQTTTRWRVNVPAGQSLALRIFDSEGHNYTTYPQIVSKSPWRTSEAYSCLPLEDQPSSTPLPSATKVDINYNYNSSRLITAIVLGCIGLAVSLVIVGIVFWICRCRRNKRERKRREEEAAAGPKPRYAQFFPYPGAAPVLYVQLSPDTPYVPVGATPEAAGARPTGAADVAETRSLLTDRDVPLSRSTTPVPDAGPSASNSTPAGETSSSMTQVPGPSVSAAGPSNSWPANALSLLEVEHQIKCKPG